MQVHFGVELLHAEWKHAVTCIGTFDGVHLGHQEVIASAVKLARTREWPAVLVTFDRHPAHILAPDRCPPAIASLQSNLANFASMGVAVAVILPFDKALSLTSAASFCDAILVSKIKSGAVVVGYDFAFGHNREGTPEWLQEHLETSVVPPLSIGGSRVSSSAIRAFVASGQVEEAARLLGRPFEVHGVVIPGRKLGRDLGYPTANIGRSFDQVMPADGVYAGDVICSHGMFRAAVGIGMRPAVQGTHRTIEAYLLDYPGHALYGESVTLQLTSRLREELNFATIDELRTQIGLDVEQVRAIEATTE